MNVISDELFSGMVPSVEVPKVSRLSEHMFSYNPKADEYITIPVGEPSQVTYIPNTRKLLYDIVQKPRNIMLPLNENRQDYTSKYILHHDTIDDDFQKLMRLFSGYINKDDEVSHNKLALLNSLLYQYFNEFNYRVALPTYKTHTKYDAYKVNTDKYEVVKFSRDVSEIFRKLEENFERAKELLRYNPETGFYMYDNIPIVCRHVYMLHDNKSLQEMAAECYADGHCKYCGTSMMNYGDIIYDDVPLSAQSLLLSFTQSFESDIDSNNLFYRLYGMLTKILRDNKDKLNKDSTTVAFVGLFILKTLKLCAGDSSIKFDQKKIAKVLDKVREYTTQMGWTPAQIDATLANNPMLACLSNVVDLIKACQYSDGGETIYSTYLSSIMFDKRAPNDDGHAKSVFRSIYEKGQDAIDEYNKKYMELLLKLWKYDYDSVVKNIDDINVNRDAVDIKSTVERNGVDFFKRACKYYCPAAIENGSCDHKWSGDSCSNCGLKKDCSNVDSVYKKYFRVITEQSIGTHIEEPVFSQRKSTYKSAADVVKEIEETNSGTLEIIGKIMQIPKAKYQLIKFIINTLNINETVMKDTVEFYNKCVAYIIARKLMDKEDLMNNLLFMFELNIKYSYI